MRKQLFTLMLCAFAVAHVSYADDPVPAPDRISGTLPDYPAIAARFNVQGSVLARLTIGTNGRVQRTEIVKSSADVFSKAVLTAMNDWEFEKADGPRLFVLRLPFKLLGGKYAFDVILRQVQYAPRNLSELSQEASPGWCEVKALIDANGSARDRLILKMSSRAFRPTCEAILDALIFDSAEDGVRSTRAIAANGLSIHVAADGQIQLDRHSGGERTPEFPEPETLN